jgi:hypothetical protein
MLEEKRNFNELVPAHDMQEWFGSFLKVALEDCAKLARDFQMIVNKKNNEILFQRCGEDRPPSLADHSPLEERRWLEKSVRDAAGYLLYRMRKLEDFGWSLRGPSEDLAFEDVVEFTAKLGVLNPRPMDYQEVTLNEAATKLWKSALANATNSEGATSIDDAIKNLKSSSKGQDVLNQIMTSRKIVSTRRPRAEWHAAGREIGKCIKGFVLSAGYKGVTGITDRLSVTAAVGAHAIGWAFRMELKPEGFIECARPPRHRPKRRAI